MPLTLANKNTPYTITRITGKDDVKRHLRNLGFAENETVSIKQSIGGNVIVEIRGARIALSDTLARRIQI